MYEISKSSAQRDVSGRSVIFRIFAEAMEVGVVMKWTGHSDYKSMKPYIDIATRTKSDAMAKIAASWEEED